MSDVSRADLAEMVRAVQRLAEEIEAGFAVIAKFHGASLHELNFGGRDPAAYDVVNGTGFMPDATAYAKALQGRLKAQRVLTALLERLK